MNENTQPSIHEHNASRVLPNGHRIHEMIIAAAGGYTLVGNGTDDTIPPGQVRLVLHQPVRVMLAGDSQSSVEVTSLKQTLANNVPFDVTDYSIVLGAWTLPADAIVAVLV